MRSRSSTMASRPCLVEAGVLDGDPGVAREELDQPLVGRREFRGAELVGEIEVADRCSLRRIGTPRNEVIGGWFGGKPDSRGGRDIEGMR